MLNGVFLTVDNGFEKRFSDAKNVVREQPERPFAIRNDALLQLVSRIRANDSLRDPQNGRPPRDELCGR